MTIFRFPIAEADAKSLGEGKSPKLVSSDHCHISGIDTKSVDQAYQTVLSLISWSCILSIKLLKPYQYLRPKSHPT